MAYGITPQGFVQKTVADIVAELEDSWRAIFGASVNLTPQSRNGQLIGIVAERLGEVWQLAEAVYNAFNPDAATDAAQDNLAALTGTVRRAATRSMVTLTATGDAGTLLSSGRVVSVQGTGVKFETLAPATLVAATAYAHSTTYAQWARVTNAGNIYEAFVGGTSAGSGGPTTTALDIPDNTVHWRYMGEGAAVIDVETQAQDTGPKVANSGTLTVIETPVSGWKGASNVLDADLGSDLETSSALRIRREDELRSAGNAAVEAVRGDVLKTSGVTAVTVFENDTDFTDGDGLPPHSLEAMIQGGEDVDIGAALLGTKGTGIQTYGSETVVVADSEGIDHTFKFSRPQEKDIYVKVFVTKDPSEYPADGDDEIKSAIVAYGDAQTTGRDTVASKLAAAANAVSGVLDVTSVLIGTTYPPVAGTTIVNTTRQLAVFDTSRIEVVAVDGTP